MSPFLTEVLADERRRTLLAAGATARLTGRPGPVRRRRTASLARRLPAAPRYVRWRRRPAVRW